MFFNSFLSLFDNKGSYKIVPCKFFCRFFHSHTIISRKTNEENYTIRQYYYNNRRSYTKTKKEALRPLLTFMVNPLRNGMYNSDRSYRSHHPSYR